MYAEVIRLGLVSLLRSNLYNFSLFATHFNTSYKLQKPESCFATQKPSIVKTNGFLEHNPPYETCNQTNARLLETPRETREWKEKSTVVFDVGRKTETTFWFEVIGSFENMKVLEIIQTVYATRLAVSSIGAIIWQTIC